MIKPAFKRYSPFIQEYIYKKGWTDLREVQIDACNEILDTDNNLIIASGTASGKTEAAFFPVLTKLESEPSKSIGVMYISPLKALINNQFDRLEEFLEDSEIPVHSWHGDISQSKKNKLIRNPKGILQITPESLEAILINKTSEVNLLFSDLKFIIIDELHAFMGTDRGLQIACLLKRIENLTGCSPRRIGLSATLNDYSIAENFLSSGTQRKTKTVGILSGQRKISLHVKSFIIDNDDLLFQDKYNKYIYNSCFNKRALIFTNTRMDAEGIISDMKHLAAIRKEPDIFYVHHGSISASLREETETALREREGPTVSSATLTLELGIDIGNLDTTIQVGAPSSCSSFVQRLGRSGRRTNISEMLFINTFNDKAINSIADLPWDLLKSIAIIQLYIEERWVEPFEVKKKPYSLLVHQTLSILNTFSELTPAKLAEKVLNLPAFKNKISIDEYRTLLLFMLENDILEQLEDKSLIIGIKAERMINNYSFYSVFETNREYTVKSKNLTIGTLSSIPYVDEVFTLAGRKWKVIDIDQNTKVIYVEPAQNRKLKGWISQCGLMYHDNVINKVRSILLDDKYYSYLSSESKLLLDRSRISMTNKDLLNNEYFYLETNEILFIPWVGTKTLETIELILKYFKQALEINKVTLSDYYIKIETKLTISELKVRLRNINLTDKDLINIAEFTYLNYDKFDNLIPKELLIKAKCEDRLDFEKALNVLKR